MASRTEEVIPFCPALRRPLLEQCPVLEEWILEGCPGQEAEKLENTTHKTTKISSEIWSIRRDSDNRACLAWGEETKGQAKIVAFNDLQGNYRDNRHKLVTSIRDNSHKLQCRRIQLEIHRNFLTLRVLQLWNKLFRKLSSVEALPFGYKIPQLSCPSVNSSPEPSRRLEQTTSTSKYFSDLMHLYFA